MTYFKRKLKFGYEKEIRISLLFFILFLVLLNFGTFVLLTRTKIELEKQFDLKLRSVATSSAYLWKNSEDKSSESFQKTLHELAFETRVKTIAFLSQEGKILVSTDSSSQKDGYSEFVGSTKKVGDFYYIPSGDKKRVWRSYIYPVFDRATESNILIFVKSEAKTLYTIERLSEIDSFLIGVGVLLILFLSFLFIRTILKPFSILREKAAQAKKRSPAQKSDVDFVIQAFSDTIAELRKKERILEGLYQGTKKDAERLSKLNEYILKSISSGVMVCDKEGRIIRLNESALKILGEVETYFLNRPFSQALEGFDQVKKILDQGLGKRIFVSNEEIEVEDKNGRRICMGVSTSSIKNERGEVLGIIMLLNDFTQLKRLQEEMAFKEKMAVLGEMSAGLAHELRNSMVSILGYSKLLKKLFTTDDSTREIIEGIINESCGMEVMLKKFLNITKPLEIVASKFDIEKVIKDAKKSTEKETLGIDFEMNFDESLPHLYGDQLLLKQVFQNLFHNAIEAMPEGGKLGVIVIPKDDFLEIDISDTGYGISQKNLKKIFNPFFSSKQKGVGLGLSLVKKIITSHQGRVEVESQEGKGTTFRIFLPFHQKVEVKKKVKA